VFCGQFVYIYNQKFDEYFYFQFFAGNNEFLLIYNYQVAGELRKLPIIILTIFLVMISQN
jgi:hypothetical protein